MKRGMLSAVGSLHHPIGFVSEAKKIGNKLWKLKVGWDDQIPEDLQYDYHWNKWKGEPPALFRYNKCY